MRKYWTLLANSCCGFDSTGFLKVLSMTTGELCVGHQDVDPRFVSVQQLDSIFLLSYMCKCSITSIQCLPGSPPCWFLIVRRLYFKVWLSWLILNFFSPQQAWGALWEPAVISVSASPVRVSHPIQNDSQGFHGNLLSRLHKRVLRVLRDLTR